MLKNVLKQFQMSEQYWGCLDKMSEVNDSPAETLNYFVALNASKEEHLMNAVFLTFGVKGLKVCIINLLAGYEK